MIWKRKNEVVGVVFVIKIISPWAALADASVSNYLSVINTYLYGSKQTCR